MSARRGGDSRQRLIVEAVRSFGAHGYRSTSLDAVAAEVGVRKQTLLYYFPSKRHLFRACIDEFAAKVGGTLERALESPKAGWQRVETVIRAVFTIAEKNPELLLFAHEAARQAPTLVERAARALEPLRERAIDFLAERMEAGEFRRQEPSFILFTLYTAVVGCLTEASVLQAVAGRSARRLTLRRRREELIRFLESALKPPHGGRGTVAETIK